MQSVPDKAMLRVDEVAVFYNVTTRTVYLWIKNRKLMAKETPGGSLRIPREALISIFTANRSTSVV